MKRPAPLLRRSYMTNGFTTCPANIRERRPHPATGPLRAGQAPYIAFLDDDDIWLPEKLEQQIAFLKNHPHCVLLGSNALIMKENQDYRKTSLPLYFHKSALRPGAL
ncbi:MAG: glycosyltransferase [Desulfobacterales bacterium]|nr:glycosyltransferase [Desulfobacterales bacterium]